jgi:hypothetical protein
VPQVGPSVGDPVALNLSDSEGLSVASTVGINLGKSVELLQGTSVERNCETEDSTLRMAAAQLDVLVSEVADLDSDSSDSTYVPSDSDCQSDTSECDDISRRITPDLDAAIRKLLHLRVNKAIIAKKLRRSHWLHTPASNHEDWFNGELKLRLRCVAPLQEAQRQATKGTKVG